MMKQNKWLFQLIAVLLSASIVLTSISFPAIAAENDVSESESESGFESEFEFESVSDESVSPSPDTSLPETAETSTNVTAKPAAQDPDTVSLSEDDTEPSYTEEAAHYIITGFVPLADDVQSVLYSYYSKPTEAEVVQSLPETLEVYLDNQSDIRQIPVSWQSVGSFDETNYCYYQFNPVWDETVYTINDNLEIPYIGVRLSTSRTRSVSSNANETTIFYYLIQDMGLNVAAAAGILANIQCESDFNPNLYGDSGTSYGICQWHESRFTALKEYTDEWETLEGQLEYLHHELATDFPELLNSLKNVSNDADGAYQAAYNWCCMFEKPADYLNVAVTRGNLAKNTYWPYYKDTDITESQPIAISGQTTPDNLVQGNSFSIKGLITSGQNLTAVTVGVYDTAGTKKIGESVSPNSRSYDLSQMDSSIKFGTLTPGGYRYRVTASTASESVTLVDKIFMVLSTKQTIANGTYYIANIQNSGYVLSVDHNRNTSGTNILLWTKGNIPYRRFQFTYQSNGYYKIKNMGSGLYLGVAGQSSSSGANVEQSTDGTLWQVLPDGSGSYYLVPKCSSTSCLDLTGGTVQNNQNIEIWRYNLRKSQRWQLLDIVANPTISGQTTPDNITQGSSFSIRGIISSEAALTSVTVGVYDTAGTMKIGKSASPGTTSYDIKALDTSIKFGTLAPGGYRYKVTVSTAYGSYTLINKIFMVLSTGQTIANGTYYIATAQNSDYVLSVDHDKKTSGTNILLWSYGNTAFRRFQFIYQGNGYYKIKNTGSGLYLGVANQSSASGANVEQSSSGTLWQVLPDGSGSYYLIPKCSSTSCLNLADSTVAKGQNIEIAKYTLGKAQRWKLSKAVSAPTISSQTVPSNMTQGSSFSIRGIISSENTLTSVTVGVYDTAGTMKIGKSVSPNAASYDLRQVDTSIKFGTLTPGGYRYKVTASTAYGSYTLIDQIFMVLSTGQTVANGTYYIATVQNSGYVLSVDHDKKTSGTNILLWSYYSTAFRRFQFIYQGNGYYKIKNTGSGLYLGVANQSSASGANVEQSTSGTLWQVLPDGSGSYYLIPKCSSTSCLNLANSTVAKGQNIEIGKYTLSKAQRWKLEK